MTSTDDTVQCPVCDSDLHSGMTGPLTLWCPECGMEYWREGNDWWRCDESGEPENVQELATDGGMERKRPRGENIGRAWDRKASENMACWGIQHPEELLSAISEEVGEIEQAYLEVTHEDGATGQVEDEIDDLGPLLFQLVESLRNHPQAFEGLPTAEEVRSRD